MNDRGLSLSLPEMLKGYVLANVRHEADQRDLNTTWKRHVQALRELGEDEDVDFFKNWLRARYAETIRPGKKGAENRDYERIGSEFHRWVRDQRERIGLVDPDAFVRFVKRDLDFYARQAVLVRTAARTATPGLESIRYNEERGFTLQTQLLLAPLLPDDRPETVRRKLQLVADFLDIWLARRVWCFRTIAYSSVRYTLFTLTRDIRGRSVDALAAYLREQLDAQPERFARNPRLRLHQQNYRQVRHILARLTHWLDTSCGIASHFEDLVSEGRARPFEIEHVWPDKYERFAALYPHPSDFDTARNQLGGLLLLQRGVNQSLGDAPYEEKVAAYLAKGENLLARSLHPGAYPNDPAFRRLREETGLPFRAYEHFGPTEQHERQVLYLRMAEWVWNPTRLSLDGVTPPVPEEIGAVDLDEGAGEGDGEGSAPLSSSALERQAFWTEVLAATAARSPLFTRVTAWTESWLGVGAGRTGLSFNYCATVSTTRVELMFSTGDRTRNKALYDQVYARKAEVEARFGGPLDWGRLDDKVTSRVSSTLELRGWADRHAWPTVVPATVDRMLRFHAALAWTIETLDG